MGPASKGSDTAPEANDEFLTVFITGNELGTMKPCGCSGGQLGGLIKRGEVFKAAQKARSVIIDAGGIVAGRSEQDFIKFNIIIRALGLLGYDMANLTAGDLEIALNLGLIGNVGPDLKLVAAPGIADVNVPAKFSKKMILNGLPVRVAIASFDMRNGRVEQIEKLFGPESDVRTVKILILIGCKLDKVNDFAEKVPFVDCLVSTDSAEIPEIIGDPKRRPLAVTSGKLGKYVGRLQIRPGKKTQQPFKLTYSAVPVSENLPEDQALAELYESYQQILMAAGLMENMPRFALAEGMEYMGSEACETCHKYAYEKWKEQKHAHAYETLEDVGSDYDPECVVCHVVGLKYESGFVSPEKTPKLRDVGCENCHGPGSEHILSVGEEPMGEPKTPCVGCHTSENSVHYAGNEAEYFEKIVHWTEPNAVNSVK
ncbi:MAG: multiheme c-type cytochrome [Planctomycetota bacterium]|jgi:hypothetical protein